MDWDYDGDVTDRTSMSGYFEKLGSAPCSWSSKKKRLVALSMCKAELYAMTDATKEAIWIRQIMTEAGYESRNAVPIRSDNASAIDCATSKHPQSALAKHIDVRLFILDQRCKTTQLTSRTLQQRKMTRTS